MLAVALALPLAAPPEVVPFADFAQSCSRHLDAPLTRFWGSRPHPDLSMISADVQRVKLDATERSLLDYQRRCQKLREENEQLHDANETQEHDSQVVLKFLREDAERKDELIESLKKTINQQRELFAAQREDERHAAAEELASVRAELTARESALTRQLSDAQDELFRLQEFKEQKTNIEAALEAGE